MADLEVVSDDVGGVRVIRPRGAINAHTVRLFEAAIEGAMRDERFRIVVSCAELAYIASAGLGALMASIEEIRSNGGDLRLAQPTETVRNIFEMLGFHHLYRIFSEESEALGSFDPPGA